MNKSVACSARNRELGINKRHLSFCINKTELERMNLYMERKSTLESERRALPDCFESVRQIDNISELLKIC